MKRTIIFVFALVSCMMAVAAPVDRKVAASVAERYFSEKSVSLVLEEQSFYVFNNPDGGWAIISGDDCTVPVLAHGDGRFDVKDMPPNMKYWMDGIRKNIAVARQKGIAPSKDVKLKWSPSTRLPRMASSQKLLQTAAWGQWSPYNLACPRYNGSASVTGCVATAMAIVLRYNQWPERGTGTIPSYKTETNNISVAAKNIDGYTYDWSAMPLTDGSSVLWTSVQKTAVSDLMAHCGAMVQMDYDPEGSGAYSCDIVPALVKYMSYSPDAVELFRSNYSNAEWFRMIRAEIDSDHPIIYGGSDTQGSGGHQFVCDGYNSNNEIHINWGWGGQYNAWYAVCYLGDTSSSGVDGVFSFEDSAIFGLRKADGSASSSVQELLLYTSGSAHGITISSGTVAKGSQFSLNAGIIYNNDYYDAYNGKVKFALVGRDGAVKEFISGEQSISLSPGYGKSIDNISCSITADVVIGDRIKLYYQTGNGNWKPVGAENDFSGSGSFTVGSLGVYDITMIEIDPSLSAGQKYYPSLLFGHKIPKSIEWYYDGSVLSKEYVTLTSGTHDIKATVKYTDNSTETVRKTVILPE